MSIIGLLKSTSLLPLTHPTVFFLDFKDQGKKFEARWLSIVELSNLEISWKTTIFWKELNSEVTIATNYTVKEGFKPTVNSVDDYHNTSYLKSHLQKCIRRSNLHKALKTAMHLYILDAEDLLRRVAIIALEDVLPLNGFSTLIWLYIAVSKGYLLSEMHYCWLLGYIYDLCQCKYYEKYQINDEKSKIDFKSLKLRSLGENGKNLSYSLMFNHSYGRVSKADKDLYLNAAEVWSCRFRVKSEFLSLLNRDVKFITSPTEPLFKDEWIYAAIDFHCYPGLLLNMVEKHDQFTEEEIKKAIWYCSSSVTNKHNISLVKNLHNYEEHFKVFNLIKRDFLFLAKFMVNKNA